MGRLVQAWFKVWSNQSNPWVRTWARAFTFLVTHLQQVVNVKPLKKDFGLYEFEKLISLNVAHHFQTFLVNLSEKGPAKNKLI